MNLLLIINAHKSPNQLNQFLNSLSSKKNFNIIVYINTLYFVNFSYLLDQHKKNKRIHFLTSKIKIDWGGSGLLESQIYSLNYAFLNNISFDYVQFLSGQDLLVKDSIFEYLLNNNADAYLKFRIDSNWRKAIFKINFPQFLLRRFDFKFHPLRIFRSLLISLSLNKIVFFKKDKTIINLIESNIFYSGYFWVCFNHKIAKYIINFLLENKNYFLIYRNSLVPDESFWTTLILNYKEKNINSIIINDDLVFIKKPINNHPPLISYKDVSDIEESKNKFFARKFDENFDKNVIDYFVKKISISEKH